MAGASSSRPLGNPAISLPSALKPARVSVSSDYSGPRQSQQQGRQSDEVGELRGSVGSGLPSATQQFYGIGGAGSGSSTRKGSVSSSKQGPPSILPHSGFLTPRKPSLLANQNYYASQRRGSGPSTRTSDVSASGSDVRQANMFLVDRSDKQDDENTRNTSAEYADPNHSRDPSSARVSGSSADESASPDGTAENPHIATSDALPVKHMRAHSRQETLASKTSREPLIGYSYPAALQEAEEGRQAKDTELRGRNDGRASESRDSLHGKRRKSSKGSIGSMLGFSRSEQGSRQGSRGVVPSMHNSQANGMPTLHEQPSPAHQNGGFAEKGGRYAPQTDKEDNDLQPKASQTLPIMNDKTHKPLKNWELLQRQQHYSNNIQKNKDLEQAGEKGDTAVRHRRSPVWLRSSDKSEKEPFEGIDSSQVTISPLGGNNRFFLGGRLVTSGDSPFPFLASFLLTLLLPAIFLLFESQFLWSSSSSRSPALSSYGSLGSNGGGKAIVVIFAYVTLIMWTSMLRTSLRDPGIIKKGLDREPDWESVAVPVGGEDDLTGSGMGRRPKARTIRVRDEWVSSKCRLPAYKRCETCQTYRPPRTSHCRLCDVCTEQTDHHCSFLNNCIGRRNYSSFITYLISSVICGLILIGSSIAHLVVRARERDIAGSYWSDWRFIGTLVLLVLTAALIVPVCGLLGYHIRLVWLGKTTIEMLRPKYPSADGRHPANPFSHASKFDNIVAGLCRPMDLQSAIRAKDFAERDARLENPAYASN